MQFYALNLIALHYTAYWIELFDYLNTQKRKKRTEKPQLRRTQRQLFIEKKNLRNDNIWDDI